MIKLKIRYRKGSKWIILKSEKLIIEDIAIDCAKQLKRHFQQYLKNSGISKTEFQLKRYEIGQKYLLIQKLEELRR